MTRTAQHLCEFGPFRLDPLKRLLLRNGEAVSITPKAFDLLLALVESGGEVVSKDDLMKRVWPDSFVEEGNLTYNVSMLRKALGERTREHQYIVTVPGRGYRFVANLNEVLGVDEEPTDRHSESSSILEATLTSRRQTRTGRSLRDETSQDATNCRNRRAPDRANSWRLPGEQIHAKSFSPVPEHDDDPAHDQRSGSRCGHIA